MIYITLSLTLLWVITLIYAQKKHKNKYAWQDTAISKYISHDRFLQLGFVSLALGLALAGFAFASTPYALPLFAISGIGALFVMLTETIIDNQRLHIVSAGIIYGLALIACVLVSWTHPFLLGVAVTNIIYVIFGAVVQDEVGDKERYSALGLITRFGLAAIIL